MYLPTNKTLHVPKLTQPCVYCQTVVTSISQDGLRPAMSRHMKTHHPAIHESTMERGPYRQYPASNKPPDGMVTKDDGRHYLACPYCGLELSSKRENLLDKMLTNYKRVKHGNEYADEIKEKRNAILNDNNDEPLVEVAVIRPYYRRDTLRARFPAPKTVMVPARWHVEGVFIHCGADGRFVAYRGRMGASEAWEVV